MPKLALRGVAALVTGGAGFIGSHLVDALVAAGAAVRVLDNLVTGSRANLTHHGAAIDFLQGDLRELETCHAACRDIELIFHQAALGSVPRSLHDPAQSMAVNVGGTANLWAAARDAGVRRIVYASSSSVYGDSPRLPKREGEEGAVLSPYAMSKKMGEELAEIYGRCFAMQLVGLRYFNVYGPRQSPEGPYAAVIPRFFAACLEGRSPLIYGDGEQSRDFTFVADAVEANLLAAAAHTDACGRAYNVAAGHRSTVRQLAEDILSIVGRGGEIRYDPPRPGDVAHSLADLTAIRAALGYEPRYDLTSGLRETFASLNVQA